MAKNTILEVKNLRVSFPMSRGKLLHIIRGVDFKLHEGEIVGIVGESGSGKSVTTRALLNVNGATKTAFESFEVFGVKTTDPRKVDWKAIRGGKIAYIPQNPTTSMNPSRKIGKQVLDIMKVHRKDIKTEKERIAYILTMFRRFRIDNPERAMKAYPHELSGGQKQRVIISMGVIAGAKILIADEPTTALDPTVQAAVLELLQEINREYKISIIFISHNIAVVSKLCDYVYVMYAGRVVEKGSKKDLFTNPRHPYTWALIASVPEDADKSNRLYSIPGTPPDMKNLSTGDPFAPRNQYAVAIDFKQEPPLFQVEGDHYAATWMLHPLYPATEIPAVVADRLAIMRKVLRNE